MLFRTTDSRELRIYTTTIPTEHRLSTLMHDPTYRISVALQNVGYNQPAQPGFYLGEGMKAQARPAITTTLPQIPTATSATKDRPPARLADIGPAPATVLIDSDEKPFDLANLKGKVVLVSFVYTTCNGVVPADDAGTRRGPEEAASGQALGDAGRIRFDHARPQTRRAACFARLRGAFRSRPGSMALSDRLAGKGE